MQDLAKLLGGVIVLFVIIFSVLKPLTKGLLTQARAAAAAARRRQRRRQCCMAPAVRRRRPEPRLRTTGRAGAWPRLAGSEAGRSGREDLGVDRWLKRPRKKARRRQGGAKGKARRQARGPEEAGGDRRRRKRSGVERAAILLLTLGETEAAEILRHMGAKEVQQLGKAMADLANVSREEVSARARRFQLERREADLASGVGGEDFVRKVLINALGEDKAATLMDRIPITSRRKGLEALKWMDPKSVAEIMRNEHPQIVSIVLSYLEPEQAAEVLNFMPEAMRSDLMIRVATMDGVRPSALSELDEMIEKSFSGANSSKTSTMGGPKVAAAIMNLVKGESSTPS